MDNHVYSRGKFIKNEIVNLVERVVVGSDYKLVFVPFEQRLISILESEASVSYWHNGLQLKEGNTFNDYYGFFTSYKGAIEEAKEQIIHFGINKNSTLELRIHIKMEEVIRLEDLSYEGVSWNRSSVSTRYQPLPDKMWYFNDEEKIKAYLEQVNLAEIEKKKGDQKSEKFSIIMLDAYDIIRDLEVKSNVKEEVLVWSSLTDESLTLENLRTKYNIET